MTPGQRRQRWRRSGAPARCSTRASAHPGGRGGSFDAAPRCEQILSLKYGLGVRSELHIFQSKCQHQCKHSVRTFADAFIVLDRRIPVAVQLRAWNLLTFPSRSSWKFNCTKKVRPHIVNNDVGNLSHVLLHRFGAGRERSWPRPSLTWSSAMRASPPPATLSTATSASARGRIAQLGLALGPRRARDRCRRPRRHAGRRRCPLPPRPADAAAGAHGRRLRQRHPLGRLRRHHHRDPVRGAAQGPVAARRGGGLSPPRRRPGRTSTTPST